MPRLSATLALVTLVAACSQPPPSGEPRHAASSSGPMPEESSEPTREREESGEPATWKAAVRLGRWQEAATLLDALPEAQRSHPELRFVRATVAMKLHDPERALEVSESIRQALPSLSSEVAELRIDALIASGRHLEAAQALAQQPDPDSQLRAAHAYRRAGREAEAKALLAQVFARLGRTTENSRLDVEARARALRSQLALASDVPAAAATDLRWLALEAPTHTESSDAAQQLDALGSTFRLKAKERYQRALAFASRGLVDATERELALITAAPGQEPTAAQKIQTQGWAWYVSRADYDEASRLLHAAAAMGGGDATRSRFYAARALARAGRDALAIEELTRLVKDAARTPWAEEAAFLIANLHFILGHWEDASVAFCAYVKRYGLESEHGKTASYSAAVAELAGRDFDAASARLAGLVKDEKNAELRERYRSLLGAALAGKEDIVSAQRELQTVVRDRPFSLPAMTARERLKALGKEPGDGRIGGKAERAESSKRAAPLDVSLPPKASLLASLGFDAKAEAALIAEEPAFVTRYAPRSSEALCLAYGQLWVAGRRYQIAQRTLGYRSYDEPLSEQNRWLWECDYPTPYAPLVRRLEANHALPSGLIFAVMRQESAFRPAVESRAGAVGLMQLMPSTALKVAEEVGTEHSASRLVEPAHNIELGAAYLAKLQGLFRRNVALSIPAYNAGPTTVSRWLESGEDLPLDVFVARIPLPETRNYVYLVLENLARYQYLASGGRDFLTLPLEIPKGIRAPEDAY